MCFVIYIYIWQQIYMTSAHALLIARMVDVLLITLKSHRALLASWNNFHPLLMALKELISSNFKDIYISCLQILDRILKLLMFWNSLKLLTQSRLSDQTNLWEDILMIKWLRYWILISRSIQIFIVWKIYSADVYFHHKCLWKTNADVYFITNACEFEYTKSAHFDKGNVCSCFGLALFHYCYFLWKTLLIQEVVAEYVVILTNRFYYKAFGNVNFNDAHFLN